MANFKCHQCGTELMKSALVCRSCGTKTKRPSTAFEKFMLVAACLVFIVPLVLFVIAQTKGHNNTDQVNAESPKVEGAE